MLSATEAIAAARRLGPAFAGRAADHDRDGSFPEADLADLRRSGLLGAMVPSEFGGAGASFADYARIASALGAGNGATALVYNMHASVTGAIARTPEPLARALGANDAWFARREQILRDAAEGRLYGVAMSERGVGSRLSALTTRFERVDGGYRIVGHKSFVSGAGHADAYLVAARDAGSEEPRLSYFLVPAGDGLLVEECWDSLGMRATGSHDLHLDVLVAPDALVGGVEGIVLLLAEVMPQWLVASYAAVYVGVARAAVDAAVAEIRGRGLAELPAVRARLGRADAQVEAAALCVEAAARLVDDAPGDPATNRAVWRAKLLAGDTAATVAASMLEAAGASASRRGHPLERLFRDARCGALQPATSDVCADWIGASLLGVDVTGGRSRW